MPDPIRKRIRDNLVAALVPKFVSVEIAREEPGELHAGDLTFEASYPRAYLHSVDDVPQSSPYLVTARRAGWVIEAYTDETAGVLADDVELLLAETIRAVMADHTRGGLALTTHVGAAVLYILVRQQRLGGFELRVDVDYRFGPDGP